MTNWFWWFAASIAAIEAVIAVKLVPAFAGLAQDGHRAIAVTLRRGVSDWAKERAMRLASLRLLRRSTAAAAGLAIPAVPILAALWLAPLPAGWFGHLALIGATVGYSIARRTLRNSGRSEHLFNRIALGSPSARAMSLEMELLTHRKLLRDAPRPQAPIFVTGFARAGTTILMRALHESGGFASLTYRDLPLPLAPNLWTRLCQGTERSVEASERGHGDGIVHDLDSPEAIEELFWLHIYGSDYRRRDHLAPRPVPEEAVGLFRDYVRLIQHRYRADRYLSKNNNNVLRLDTLVSAFPDAHLLHPFRDPVAQASSLARQHENARALAERDPHRGAFTTWLGHHEFGGDHRPFAFHNARPEGDPATIDYWLARWADVYGHLLAQPDHVALRQVFVDYDRIATDRAIVEPRLSTLLGSVRPISLETIRAPAPGSLELPDSLAAARAYGIHGQLQARFDATFAAERMDNVRISGRG